MPFNNECYDDYGLNSIPNTMSIILNVLNFSKAVHILGDIRDVTPTNKILYNIIMNKTMTGWY